MLPTPPAKHYIINKHGHYFIVEGPIDVDSIQDAQFFNDTQEMYDAAALQQGLTLEEIEYQEYLFKLDPHTKEWMEYDTRGFGATIEDITDGGTTIEAYLSEWEL